MSKSVKKQLVENIEAIKLAFKLLKENKIPTK